MLNQQKPVALPNLDGVGCLLDKENNAIAKANKDELQKDCPMAFSCSGSVVGLLGREIDNSEVGYFHIDMVRYVPQDSSEVNDAMVDIRNYANCDTVGYVGIMDVAVLAVQAVNALSVGVQMLITSAHHNIEPMVDKKTGQPHTAHTATSVFSVSSVYAGRSLFALASAVLAMSGVFQSVEMTVRSLIKSV